MRPYRLAIPAQFSKAVWQPSPIIWGLVGWGSTSRLHLNARSNSLTMQRCKPWEAMRAEECFSWVLEQVLGLLWSWKGSCSRWSLLTFPIRKGHSRIMLGSEDWSARVNKNGEATSRISSPD